jgi:hypothetical protein
MIRGVGMADPVRMLRYIIWVVCGTPQTPWLGCSSASFYYILENCGSAMAKLWCAATN